MFAISKSPILRNLVFCMASASVAALTLYFGMVAAFLLLWWLALYLFPGFLLGYFLIIVAGAGYALPRHDRTPARYAMLTLMALMMILLFVRMGHVLGYEEARTMSRPTTSIIEWNHLGLAWFGSWLGPFLSNCFVLSRKLNPGPSTEPEKNHVA